MRPVLVTALIGLLVLPSHADQAQNNLMARAVPSTFSQGDPQAASGLASLAWWERLGDATLNDLMARAVKGSLTLQQAQARILQARATLTTAKADQRPSVKTSASLTRSQESAQGTGVAPSPSTLYQVGFDASWEIDFFGTKRKAREAAQDRYEARIEDMRDVVLTLLGDVATQYVTLRGYQSQLALTRQSADTQQQTVALTEARFRLGLTSALDVAQAKAQLAATRAEIPPLEASARQSIHGLSLLLGLEPLALENELSEARPLPSYQGAIATGLPSELLARRPDLRSAERDLAAAMADVGAAKAELYPKFDLTFGLGLRSLTTTDFTAFSNRYWSIIPGLTLPLFNRGSLKADVAKKEAICQEKLAAFRAAYQTALADVENALASYAAENGRRQDLEESLLQSQEAFRLSQERYRRGLTSFLDVLTTQAALQSAQNNLSQSETRLLTHLVSLYKSLGGGWDATSVTS